jgi:hypothetical protein
MRKEPAREFYVNGHRCQIEYERREKYSGWIDGEQITTSHAPKRIRETLISDAKYRVEVKPEFDDVLRAVYDFLERQTDRDGNYLWVYNQSAIDEVTPMDTVGYTYTALLDLEGQGYIEQERVVMDLNVDKMWRVVDDDPEDLSGNTFNY